MDHEIEASFQLSYPDFKTAYFHNSYRKGLNIRPRIKLVYIMSFLGFLYALFIFSIDGFASGFWGFYVVCMLLFLLFPLFFHLALLSRIKGYYWEYSKKGYQYKFGFSQDAIHFEKIGKEEKIAAEYGYNSFTMVVETESAFILYVLEVDSIYMPKNVLTTETTKRLGDLLKNKLCGRYYAYAGSTAGRYNLHG